MLITKKQSLLVLVAVFVLAILFVAVFPTRQGPDYDFILKSLLVKYNSFESLESIRPQDESLESLVTFIHAKSQLEDLHPSYRIVSPEEAQLVESKFTALCGTPRASSCTLTKAILPYFTYYSRVKRDGNEPNYSALLKNESFSDALDRWNKYYLNKDQEFFSGMDTQEIYSFSTLVAIRSRTGLMLKSEREFFLESSQKIKMSEESEYPDYLLSMVGKLRLFNNLLGVEPTYALANDPFAQKIGLKEELCPRITSHSWGEEIPSPCISGSHLSLLKYCDKDLEKEFWLAISTYASEWAAKDASEVQCMLNIYGDYKGEAD